MNVAFIPVRGGSKSIPLKNIKKINGRPLVYWVLDAADKCEEIDLIYVATDSDKIRNVVEKYNSTKLRVIGRSKESAEDSSSTEFAMLEFAENHEFDNIILIQATSPLLEAKDIKSGFEELKKDGVDSVLSVVKQKRFIWREDKYAEALNYNYYNRPRRQEFDGYYVENGAFYITSKQRLLKSRCRISGNIKIVEMEEDSYYEIDELSDWDIVEKLLKNREKNYSCKQKIKMLITDCDGCLTDGGMYYSELGDEVKKFNTKDGMGFSLIREKGILTGIITGESNKIVENRAKKLKIDELHIGISDKYEVIKTICKKYSISIENIAYIGDDINDIEVLKKVGYSACPNDAINEVKEIVNYCSNKNGGQGVIRDVINNIFEI